MADQAPTQVGCDAAKEPMLPEKYYTILNEKILFQRLKTMTRKNKNIAIIGGGHNSLVSAAYLAKAGFNVELYESRSEVGAWLQPKN